ncbi:binding-protein-dependent transport systems inner membrane component [Desulforamulus reducens MI-1]|uniref:Binding-protein-dependent transport systems inner membrane component n=1 Tax=Desulforamulus reducens (strain ATCC BAA-1160 / DSM 100696 / MI-1) TaxID=349161 RepID=A4J6S7_DESRM|nr:ABC transporter permease [Desulforamulus reducens]ABO50780.1 binding-protein-dependent transport systems inner membrane component [Desulforamulus reducens MI-1]
MDVFWQGLKIAIQLLLAGDKEIIEIALLTLKVSSTATLIAVFIGVPMGFFLALTSFPGRNLLVSLINYGMGLPPVVVGLVVWLLLSRYGPLGLLGMLYTPGAMIVAQGIIAFPIVAGFTLAAFQQLHPKLKLQILSLGASKLQLLWLMAREARMGLLAAVIAGFGGAVSEVGASMMVGGNLVGYTRTLTTATVLAVNKGQQEFGMALSLILLIISFAITVVLTTAQQRGRCP